ncbi:MAG: helix-turn-helix transcriptional regulator [Clostridia bacterium]|nr:helix-turn-helix transcriptional regulator [Clostridia bacterium]
MRELSSLQSSVFDSNLLHRSKPRTQPRLVQHYELEIFHTDSGQSHVDDNVYPIRRGMILCAKPGQIRYSDLPVRCSFIRITPQEGGEIDEILQGLPNAFFAEEETDEILAKFEKISVILTEEEDVDAKIRVNALLLDVIYRCLRLARNEHARRLPDAGDRIVAEAMRYLNQHFTEPCSLQDLARAVHVSPNHLHAVFHKKIGVTPYEYTVKKRIEKAKQLIRTGEYSLSRVAEETGYCSQSHFNKAFKSMVGQTPSEYRRSILEEY